MGFILSKLFKRLTHKEREYKIIIVGLHNAGKTTILYKLALGEVIITQPTIGSNVEEVKHQNIRLQVWDLGGQENLRQAWDTYYENTDAVIYVVDSADEINALVSKMEFLNLLIHNDLKDARILVFANKADMPTAKSEEEIAEEFGLHEIKNHEWYLKKCCALTGEGINEGLDWLTEKLSAEKKQAKSGSAAVNVTKLPDHPQTGKGRFVEEEKWSHQ